MLTIYHCERNKLCRTVVQDEIFDLPKDTFWIDLLLPTPDEELIVERLLSIEVLSRKEMQEIEDSSRLFIEHGHLVMTLPVLDGVNKPDPELTPVTFMITPQGLLTVRYADPHAFILFAEKQRRNPPAYRPAVIVLMDLLDQIVETLADTLEQTSGEVENISRSIFRPGEDERNGVDYKNALRMIGRVGDTAAKSKNCLLNFSRLLGFVHTNSSLTKDGMSHLRELERDVGSIGDHVTFISNKASFLLDATLGLINIEQNSIIKIFSVAAVAFLPPTLVASIYGMNFRSMPELEWVAGYPMALALIVISALLPLAYFRRKKWL